MSTMSMIEKQETSLEKKSYAKLPEVLDIPNLIQVQLDSYRWFQEEGLKELFQEVSPIQDFTGARLELHFVGYEFRQPQFTIEECYQRDITYSAPLYVKAQLIVKETGEIKEQEIFFGDIPIMTNKGTFGLRYVTGWLGGWLQDPMTWQNLFRVRTGRGTQKETEELVNVINYLIEKHY